MKERGKFIVIYGVNNLGKSAQVELLTNNLREKGKVAEVVKYPIYSLEPTGPKINAALREGLEMTAEELQREFAQNRRDFEPILINKLNERRWVVSEDYKGTGIAWGVTYGLSLKSMENINERLINEDLAILLEGNRFSSGIERRHRHERSENWEIARKVHLELAKIYGWEVVDANQSMLEVSNNIWQIVEREFFT